MVSFVSPLSHKHRRFIKVLISVILVSSQIVNDFLTCKQTLEVNLAINGSRV